MANREWPTRGWRFWALVVAIFVTVVAISPGVGVLLDISPWFTSHRWVAAIISGLAVGVLSGPLSVLLTRRRLGGRLEGAVREFGNTWRRGRLTVSPGRIVFEPYRRQTRITRGTREEFRVDRIGGESGRRPPLRLVLSMNPQLHIVDLDTDHGPRELALVPASLTTLRERLAEPSPSGER